MNNQEIANIFYEIADILEIQNVQFKPRAYRRAAQSIESISKDIKEVYKEGKLREIPGVGENIAKKIAEIVETGKLKYYEGLKKQMSFDIEALTSIEGLGPKTAKLLYDKLKIKNLKDLEKAAKSGKISKIKHLGEKTQKNILEGLGFAKEKGKRYLLGYVLPEANAIKEMLEKNKFVEKVSLAGSIRRMQETIGDIDILAVSSKADEVMDYFTKLGIIGKVLAKGSSKSSVKLKSGIQVDLRIVDKSSFGSALQYFIGSKAHSIKTRTIAMGKGFKLNEYGVFNKKTNKKIAGATEEEVYKKIGLPYFEPELREDRGEIEAALKEKLPKLVNYSDVKGDFQMHTKYSDGNATIKDMAEAAIKLGHKFICITDHVGNLKVAHSMDNNRLLAQIKEVEKINKKYDNLTIFKGAEVNITKDGNLDMPNKLLKELDIVYAAVHSGFKQDNTARIIKAMENEHVDIIAHPTGRLLNERKGYELNFEKIFDAAKRTKTCLEINAFPNRLDLNDVNTKAAIEAGVKIAIGTDAHSPDHLHFVELGTAVARRGWCTKKDIVNTYSVKDIVKLFS